MTGDRRRRVDDLSPEQRARALRSLREQAREKLTGPRPRDRDSEGELPLSHSQHRLWVIDQLQPGSRLYNEFSATRIAGEVDHRVLERAVSEIVRRHEILRTTFPAVDGRPVQVIGAPAGAGPTLIDLTMLDEREQGEEVTRLADEATGWSFDLATGPLLRTQLLRLAEREHVLFVSAHHIVLDGWSIAIFWRELVALVGAYAADRPSPLPELPIQYADFALWQRQRVASRELDAHLGYWVDQLRDLPPQVPLPIARPVPEHVNTRGARHHFELGAGVARAVAELCRGADVTPFMTLLAAFHVLLSRYSAERDVVVGTAAANRTVTDTEELIGFFVNMLALRVDLAGDPSVRELLGRVKRACLEAYEHAELPFESVVEATRADRAYALGPPFRVVFDLQNTPAAPADPAGWRLESLEVGAVPARFDLILSMRAAPGALSGYWQYDADLFDGAAVRRMTGHLETLLGAMAADPARGIESLPLLTASERRQMLVEWNRTDAPWPESTCIHQLVEAQAARTPRAVAVACGDRTITYEELDRRAGGLARRLRALGVVPESPVGVHGAASVEVVVALIGVLKAGGAYVVLDPAYPRADLLRIGEEARLAAVVTPERLRATAPAAGAPVVGVDDPVGDGGGNDPGPVAAPGNAAYVVFTSGSTGVPKGVVVSHANLVHATAARHAFYRDPVTSFLLLSPLGFDSSAAGIYWTLTQGGTLVLPEGDDATNPAELRRLIRDHAVSHVLAIPALYEAILLDADQGEMASLRAVIVAGEPCPASLVAAHERLPRTVALFNEYGPSEATVWATVHECRAESETVPIGRPIANTRVYVLDDGMRPVPIGVPGELHVAGNGVARGSLHRPAETAERFVPSDLAPDRLYRTGDLARYRPDGALEFVGRTDHQVKVRGARVELGAIEHVLLQHPAVHEACAVARERARQGRRVVAYAVPVAGQDVRVDELDRLLAERLPLVALPSELRLLDALPRLPNGKVDRVSLAMPPATPVTPPGDGAADGTWSDLERALAELWTETLELATVSRHDDFFAVGGDSLSVVHLHNRIRHSITDRPVAITHLFKYPTISSLAAFIEQATDEGEI